MTHHHHHHHCAQNKKILQLSSHIIIGNPNEPLQLNVMHELLRVTESMLSCQQLSSPGGAQAGPPPLQPVTQQHWGPFWEGQRMTEGQTDTDMNFSPAYFLWVKNPAELCRWQLINVGSENKQFLKQTSRNGSAGFLWWTLYFLVTWEKNSMV